MLEALLTLIVAVMVFLAAAVGDYVEAYYMRAVADLDARLAAYSSIGMYAVSLIGFLAVYKMSVWLVAPEAVGVGVGAWIAVRRQLRARTRATNA